MQTLCIFSATLWEQSFDESELPIVFSEHEHVNSVDESQNTVSEQ